MSEDQYIRMIYIVGTVLASIELTAGFWLRQTMRAPARGFLVLGCVQIVLLLLFRYGDTWFPQPPSADLGGATFLQPMVVALDMLITVLAVPSLALWAIITLSRQRRVKKGPNNQIQDICA